jgi:hypothetical protein
MVEFYCSKCSYSIKAPECAKGVELYCPSCGKPLSISEVKAAKSSDWLGDVRKVETTSRHSRPPEPELVPVEADGGSSRHGPKKNRRYVAGYLAAAATILAVVSLILIAVAKVTKAPPGEVEAKQEWAEKVYKKPDSLKHFLSNRAAMRSELWGNKPPLDVIDIYEVCKTDPASAKTKYHDRFVLITGIVHEARYYQEVNGVLVYLRHRRGPNSFRYDQREIALAFVPQVNADMGFDIRFSGQGIVLIPFHDGGTYTFSGLWDCEKLGLKFPRLE